ncbi:Transcription initiation factor TFIID subunit 2 [Branchiostoma belcheri]|nr:Transcription initiation factor TFIID subunit 2 [Branchiostoma belcheri]
MTKTNSKKDKDKSQDPLLARPYKVSHQTLCITGVNFKHRAIIGYVELTIIPQKSTLSRVKLNSKQCRIYRVTVNGAEAAFDYSDPTLEVCQGDTRQRNLDYFSTCHVSAVGSVDSDMGNGELNIHVPHEVYSNVSEGRPLQVSIEFSLEKPKGGLQFVVPDMEGTMAERGAHVFSYGLENSSRLWFPCVDSYSELCTWKLEFTVDAAMTAVSCGDLVDTVFTADSKKKTFHYVLSIPTSAPNIAVAIGPFEILVDPHMHEVTYFCLPHLMSLLKHTADSIHRILEFYEELLSWRYPYTCYKAVFVDQSYENAGSYASLTIFNTNLLHTPRIIDQTPYTRRVIAYAVAQQFFGCYVCMHSWSDVWVGKGIAGYLLGQYIKKFFGKNEYRYWIHSEQQKLVHYETEKELVVLHSKDTSARGRYFHTRHPHTTSWIHSKMAAKKSHLITRLVEQKIGFESLLQVFNKLLSLATSAAGQKFSPTNWSNMLLSSASFVKLISTVSGKDIHLLLDQWVYQGGVVHFSGSFVFNRKRNLVELELNQRVGEHGIQKYVGPLTVTIQELDGSFNHSVQIEDNTTRHELVCHSKSRRNKKKKIPLVNGEEVDMDLSAMDADSPVLWIRIDPQLTLVRKVEWQQPDFMWQYQLRYERDIIAQHDSIQALEQFPTPASRLALTDILENESCFYRVRMEAAFCLSKVANAMVSSWMGPPAMMSMFKRMFCTQMYTNLIKCNNFSNLQGYFLQKTMPVAMGAVRDAHGRCPKDVLQFILQLIKYNDNSKNKFSDNYYRASLIDALTATVTPSVTMLDTSTDSRTEQALLPETKAVLEDVVQHLNLEKLLPCYQFTITVSCLKAVSAVLEDVVRHLNLEKLLPCYQFTITVACLKAVSAVLEDVVRHLNLEKLLPCYQFTITVSCLKAVSAVLEDVVRHLNLEKLLPCYQFTITVACLKAIRTLQKNGHLPSNAALFKSYADPGQFVDVRLVAMEILTDFVHVDQDEEVLGWLLDYVENDPIPYVRHKLLQLLLKNPPFTPKEDSKLNKESLVERLWTTLNTGLSYDARLRCDLVDLYYTMFGRVRPSCLPPPEFGLLVNLKEKKAAAVLQEDDKAGSSPAETHGVKRKAETDPLPPTTPLLTPSDPTLEVQPQEGSNKMRIKIK